MEVYDGQEQGHGRDNFSISLMNWAIPKRVGSSKWASVNVVGGYVEDEFNCY